MKTEISVCTAIMLKDAHNNPYNRLLPDSLIEKVGQSNSQTTVFATLAKQYQASDSG